MRFSLIIFDLDNTIYDWYAAFLPAFYEMVGTAASILDYGEDSLLEELRQIHIKHRDVEHPFAIMETDIVRSLIAKIGIEKALAKLDPAFHAFNKVRKANLRLYPAVAETLEALSSRGVRLVAYTDSKYFAAVGRIERLQLSEKFLAIYCRKKARAFDFTVPAGSSRIR